jgi:cyanophycin synthetase
VLETDVVDPASVAAWRHRVQAMCEALGWPPADIVAVRHAQAMSLAFAAPADRLLAATELNEWAWVGAAGLPVPCAPGFPAPADFDSARQTLAAMTQAEANPRLLQLLAQAREHGLPGLADDEHLSIGAGEGSGRWPLGGLPAAPDWTRLHDVPTALVTGSNGKTTTVRLVAAMLAAHGLRAGFNCTDGVFVGDERLVGGDYSGPTGARQVLRDQRVQAAVLETARGGLLRRGLAVTHAHAAIVTNVSADHFGEYGVDSLEDLADAKLVVARAIGADGWLVLNADDVVLRRRATGLCRPTAWFSLEPMDGFVADGPGCWLQDGRMRLRWNGVVHNLGAIGDFPLAMGGAARYNLSNLAGAALVAAALGVPPTTIARVMAAFGRRRGDNPGRLERWSVGGAAVLLDYAHNPEGLQGLLVVAQGLRAAGGRLALLLGQAGNREDEAIAELARVAAAARPAQVVLKDIEGYLRGRDAGEVAALLARHLVAAGVPPEAISVELSEVAAGRQLVSWARPGDVVVLPIHNLQARAELAAWLDARSADAT